MLRRFLSALISLPIMGLFVYTVLLNRAVEASPQEVTVVTKTSGLETLKATVLGEQVTITLKNNHNETMTAYALSFGEPGDTWGIRSDFTFTDVRPGIAPGDVEQNTYILPTSFRGPKLPTLYLLAVFLEDGSEDGDPIVVREMKDQRLGQKIQFLRALKILDKEEKLSPDLKALKGEIVARLSTTESESLTALNELLPPNSSPRIKLSDNVKAGLQWGRESMLNKLEDIEALPSEWREEGFMRLKARLRKYLKKI